MQKMLLVVTTPQKNHLTVKFLSALQSLLASFSSTVQCLPRAKRQADKDS